ncbi:sensor histidine kinase [Kitasatospora sp. NPDC051853]|uniref:sensor histidine kinase n=1 Tax=Kitasatospora sp. NPDC051853 TaxID=3364058 RepID=UPI0037898C61
MPWTHTDALVAAGACTLNVLSYVFFGDPTGEHRVSVVGLLLVAAAALPLLFRRSRPLPVLAAVVLLDVLATLLLRLPTHFGATLIVGVFSVARACPPRVTAVAAVATAALLSWSQTYDRAVTWQESISPLLSVLFVVGGGLAVNRWQREVAANRQLLADRAVADERRRIARELHDIVAHHITTMQLMAGGARANLANPEVAREALVTLEASGRLALREMRQLLDVLRTGDEPDDAPAAPQPGVEDLDRLVAESERAGLPAVLTVDGARRPLPPTVGLTVYRIAQEALTNARKHAGPARAEVRLTYRPESVAVEVRDDGAGPSPEAGPGGYGLVGMRERVTLHGGTLTAGPLPEGGFAVLADLPLSPAESAEAAVQNGDENR